MNNTSNSVTFDQNGAFHNSWNYSDSHLDTINGNNHKFFEHFSNSVDFDDILTSQTSSFFSDENCNSSFAANSTPSGTDLSEINSLDNTSSTVDLEFFLKEHAYSNNQGKYVKVLKHHLGYQLLFVERDKTVLVCVKLALNEECLSYQLENYRILMNSATQLNYDLIDFEGYHGYTDKATNSSENCGLSIPFRSAGQKVDLKYKCIFGIKFKHLNSKFGKSPLFIHTKVCDNERILGECSFQLMCCASPTRDANRYLQRNNLGVQTLNICSIAELFLDSRRELSDSSSQKSHQISNKKRKNSEEFLQFDDFTEEELSKDGYCGDKKRYVIQTTDFGIYCVLQRMAHELTNYREQLKLQSKQKATQLRFH